MKILYIYLNDETTQEDVKELVFKINDALSELDITGLTQYDPFAKEDTEDAKR